MIGAVAMIAFGALYLIKPDIYQRLFWKRTALSQRILTPDQNIIYMRVLGMVFIVIGILLYLKQQK